MKTSYLDRLPSCHGKTFRRRIGIRRRTFRPISLQVWHYLEEERQQQPLSRRGKKSTALNLTEKLLVTFVYLRQYPPFDELGTMCGVSESYANKISHRYLDILVKVFRLPGKKALLDEGREAMLLDVSEQPIERPLKNQRDDDSGKKKRHTITAQLIACLKTLQILLVVCGKGRTYDSTLLKPCTLRIQKKLKTYKAVNSRKKRNNTIEAWQRFASRLNM